MAEEASEEERKQRLKAAKTRASASGHPTPLPSRGSRQVRDRASRLHLRAAAPNCSANFAQYIGIQISMLIRIGSREHAARMTPWTRHHYASDMIDSLTLIMNRARQARSPKDYRNRKRSSSTIETD